ncbi:ABC transporter ATP-binding protein [Gluconobacter wancherniae]|uniref:Sugar ABC transporter ATP-binding protein n=1 Tax=Gluconobacter wancherniae NBRC 103581 TaxID=656744 RepID=A0A511AZU4_9PROT|nr:sn-glycerol-3-phosphate ABC transporter ATP-binding protein UgpC [Gluconobacter wancherniae]MBF0853264.1 sn-glycerol-3-phosphate ABC transporter ATP-binding protein UgpC [Gluconobacter wancherniae]GBD56005.1 sugar ABC transporter ATP-binding protein [Gluconobacter wancherniae NBRC 103581]GBR63014.1 mannitol/sorbitol ABC transporter permease [Gluconobacter wancherniae NBRC 103581]GEK93092.1 sugar ABC transporter ATP-binding protein [Gluconobacter wancherniae NBRC 103581]
MATLELKNLRKTYLTEEIIKGVSLSIEDREFVVFVGPSGCGKSTLLRMIAGLEDISNGDLLIDGQRVNDIEPGHRGLAMVFQSYALYPHMNVYKNMEFGLKLAGMPEAERREKITAVAKTLQLETYLHHKPGQLSGGQRQRVAIGRAIVRNPKVFLFDEPLSNLDAALRGQMRVELASLHRKLGATTIYVTHDQVEAMTMADKIVVLQKGVVEQVGSPLELYHHPRNMFVAKFIGSPPMNFLPATLIGREHSSSIIEFASGSSMHVPVYSSAVAEGSKVTVGIRPEHIEVVEAGEGSGKVEVVERLGALTLLHIRLANGQLIVVQTDGSDTSEIDSRVGLHLPSEHCHIFAEDGLAFEALNRHPLAA